MSNKIECAKRKIRILISRSPVPEDPRHAENTLEWLLRLKPDAGWPLKLAALAHDIDRAVGGTDHADFADYDAFKSAHARNGARLLRPLLEACEVPHDIADEDCRLVESHEVGGDPPSDLLKEADGISFFDVNLPLYYQREGWAETKRRVRWGYLRLSPRGRKIVAGFHYEEEGLNRLLQEVVREASANA